MFVPAGGGQTSLKATSGTEAAASPPNYLEQAASGIQALQQWYAPASGVYAPPAGWWNSANAITVLVDYERVSGSRAFNAVLAGTFSRAQSIHANFVNDYYDDDGWWALAWINAYDLTGDPEYLSMAETIFTAISGGWDTSTCGGGMWWSTPRTYKNAIANELFIAIAAKLANRTAGDVSAGYLRWAELGWRWFKGSGLINAQNLINDGLVSTHPNACTNNRKTTWSYNQGVILGGLVELSKADQDPTLIPEAETIANAAIAHLTAGGILTDKSVAGGDAPQFKGIFLRNLMALYVVARNPRYKTFTEVNANSILTRDESSSEQFGALWQGPVDSADPTRQSSALDALIAAAAMQ
jgi:predicted alpha-1,6-mannanase (GH76 family)